MLAETVWSFHGNDTAVFSDFFWNSAFTVVKTSFPTLWALLATLTEMPKMITNYNKIKIHQLLLNIINKLSTCLRFYLMKASNPILCKGFKNILSSSKFERRSPLVIFYFKEKFCVSHASTSRLRDVYLSKAFGAPCRKKLSLVVFDSNCSFKR